jgi:hypothetical protein
MVLDLYLMAPTFITLHADKKQCLCQYMPISRMLDFQLSAPRKKTLPAKFFDLPV